MTRMAFLLAATAMLGGCLETAEPVFDASNAKPVAEQKVFLRLVEFVEEAGPKAGLDPEQSPREILEKGGFAVDLGDFVLVQDAEEEGKVSYSAFAVLADRAFLCSPLPDEETKAAAPAYGVTIVEPDGGGPEQGMRLEGDKDKIATFIRDQIETGPLICLAIAKGRRTAPQ